ncbi:MAG: hypothetical protein GY724_20885, partial [Actinomycetia bacterium]|nr:hypothetical protein [Actinomycetes bacterium]
LKISRVVLPSPNHPIGFLAEQGRKPTISPIRSEGGQTLGLIAVAGLIGAIAATLPLGAGVESFAARKRSRPERGELLRSSGLMMLIILLLAVPSGLAYLASMIGFEEIRTWNRIVVYLGFFALVSAAIGLERISAWLRGRGVAPWLVSAFMIGVGVLGIYDQAPGTRFNYESRTAAWNRDADFFAAVEAELLAPGFTGGDPSESEGEGEAPMVYQLPLVPYPEPESGLLIYDHYRGYLHTDTVAWSYGAMRGRDAFHWQRELSQWPAAVGLDALAAVGFDGVYLDRAGYVDGGAAIRGEMGAPSEFEDDRQLFFALEDGATRLGGDWSSGAIDELADEILYPARPVLGTGFHATNLLDDEGGAFATDDAAFDLVIGDDSSRRVTLTVRVGTGPGGGHRVTLATADGGEVLAEGISDPGSREVRFELDVEVPSGGLPLRLTTDSPQFQLPGDARQINMQVLEIRAVGPALARLLDQHGQPIGSPGLK